MRGAIHGGYVTMTLVKALFITKDTDVLREGTAARSTLQQYATLVEIAFVIVLNDRRDRHEMQKVSETLWIFPTNSWKWWTSPFDARRVARKELWFQRSFQTELIVALDPAESALAGWLIQRFARRPLAIEIMQDIFSRLYTAGSTANLLRSDIARFVLPYAQSIRVGSENIRASLFKVSPILAEGSFLLPRFIDMEQLIAEPIRADLHKKYPAFKFIILMVTPLVSASNVELALHVLKDILQSYGRVGLIVVGEGKDRERLFSLAQSLGIAEHVVFEHLSENLSSYYKTANLFLVTAVDESYGDTLVDAAGNGCAIVTTKVGVASTIIEHGDSGFLCDPDHPETFVTSILSVINNPGVRARLRVNSALFLARSVAGGKEGYMQTLKRSWEKTVSPTAEPEESSPV